MTDVVVRVDHSVPLGLDGALLSSLRIDGTLDHLRALASAGHNVTILTHLGNPKDPRSATSVRTVYERVRSLLGEFDCSFAPTPDHALRARRAWGTGGGHVQYLENLRAFSGETQCDNAFAIALARLGDAYINDAFSVSHRAHASTALLPRLLPAYAGPALRRDCERAQRFIQRSGTRTLIVGGVKLRQKCASATRLLDRVDSVFLAGAGAALVAGYCDADIVQRLDCGVEEGRDAALGLLRSAADAGIQTKCCDRFTVLRKNECIDIDAADLCAADTLLDVARVEREAICADVRSRAATLWFGPLGRYEIETGLGGCASLAREFNILDGTGSVAVLAGGGDTSAAVQAALGRPAQWCSPAGGALIEYLSGGSLPNLDLLGSKSFPL